MLPELSKRATAEYLAAEDVLGRWLEGCTVVQTRALDTSKGAFRKLAHLVRARNQEHAGSQKRFSESLDARGFAQRRTNAARGFDGIGLVTDVTDAPLIPVSRVRACAGERSI